MFTLLYREVGGDMDNGPYDLARTYLEGHPSALALLMDKVWAKRDKNLYKETLEIEAMPENAGLQGAGFFPHLIYAYMIENTRIYEIFAKVIFEFLHGEKLGFPTHTGTYKWIRAAEELFYASKCNYFVHSIVSNIRPDIRASRRNAYYRLLGMDLSHGEESGANYPYHKPTAANKDFVSLFEELLSEIWIGIAYSNVDASAYPIPTDEAKMNNLIVCIRELLTTRKQAGNLSREEFYHVATMSWMHLTLAVQDAPIVQDMGISAESPAERLRQMGEKVGLPCHPKSDAFFKMAEDISEILNAIEHFPGLKSPHFFATSGPFRLIVERVITQWSIATGKDLKSVKIPPD